MLGRYWRPIALLVVVVIGVIVVARALEQRSEEANGASETETDLIRRGVTDEEGREFAVTSHAGRDLSAM